MREFYSVAQHAVLVRGLVVEAGHPRLALLALHHDSHEAYVGDVPTPLKRLIGGLYEEIAARLDVAIAAALETDWPKSRAASNTRPIWVLMVSARWPAPPSSIAMKTEKSGPST